MEALLALVAHDKPSKSASKPNLFDYMCEREGIVKRVEKRRFAKLGKAASSLLQADSILCELLDETDTFNQLTESCQSYLENELFVTELETFAYFNH